MLADEKRSFSLHLWTILMIQLTAILSMSFFYIKEHTGNENIAYHSSISLTRAFCSVVHSTSYINSLSSEGMDISDGWIY